MNGITSRILKINATHISPNSTSSTTKNNKNLNNSINNTKSTKQQQQITSFCVARDNPITKPVRNPHATQEPEPEVLSFQTKLTPQYEHDFNWLGVRINSKQKRCARFWSQIFNGISTSDNLDGFHEELHALSRYDIQFIALTETNVNTSNAYIRDNIEQITQSTLPASRISMSSNSTDNVNETRQYGGTLLVAHKMLASRVASCGRDEYGRFSWIQFFGKKHHVKVYTIYNPVPHHDSSKHDSAVWIQQRTILQKNGVDTNPNEHLLSTLLHVVDEDVSTNRRVMVFGDFKFNIFDGKINQRFEAHDLVTDTRSWFRGKSIIDGFWCTQLIRSNICAL